MNILPKKSWHVRTKKNIERVRRDEAEAAANEKELQKRAKIADLEASLDVLRKRNRDDKDDGDDDDDDEEKKEEEAKSVTTVELVNPCGSSGAGHLNLFREVEQAQGKLHGANAEAEAEKKKEAEEWEKKVGILQYLGQSTEDPKRFYQKAERTLDSQQSLTAKQQREKDAQDPILNYPWARKLKSQSAESSTRKIEFESAAGSSNSRKSDRRSRRPSITSSSSEDESLKRHRKRKKAKKSKRRKTPSSESDPESEEERKRRKKANLELLRKQRLEREEKERKRAEELLSRLTGKETNNEEAKLDEHSDRNRRYNSQYNPHLARH